MIYRSLVVGLLGAIALLLAEQGEARNEPPVVAWPDEAAVQAYLPVESAPVTVVHLSRRAAGRDPAAALGLGGTVRPVDIDGESVECLWRAALDARWAAAVPGSYFELTVRGGESLRRMLVLVMP